MSPSPPTNIFVVVESDYEHDHDVVKVATRRRAAQYAIYAELRINAAQIKACAPSKKAGFADDYFSLAREAMDLPEIECDDAIDALLERKRALWDDNDLSTGKDVSKAFDVEEQSADECAKWLQWWEGELDWEKLFAKIA